MPSSAFGLYALPPSTSDFLRPRVEGDSEVASVCSFLQPLSHDKGAAGEPWRGGGGPRKVRAAVGGGVGWGRSMPGGGEELSRPLGRRGAGVSVKPRNWNSQVTSLCTEHGL